MTNVNKGNAVALDKYIDASRARVYYGNMALVYPEKGAYSDCGAWEKFRPGKKPSFFVRIDFIIIELFF
jgi:hypothetical protein